jgi:hypothetical protein
VQSDPDPLAEADAAAMDLLRLYEALGVPAVLMTLTDGALYVRCQNAGDVVPLCRRVVDEHEAPSDRTLQ